MNGKEVLDYLNAMSEEELINTEYDLIGFDLNDVTYHFEEYIENGFCSNEKADLLEEKFKKMSDAEKVEILKRIFDSRDADIYRSGYVESLGDCLRDEIINRLDNE